MSAKTKSNKPKLKKNAKDQTQEQRGQTAQFTQSILFATDANPVKPVVEEFLSQHALLSPDKPATDISWFNTEGESLKIKAVREIISQTSYSSYSGQRPVYVLLDADNSSIPAQNALLKIIEEPPNQSLIILTAQQPKQLLPTIRSRCVLINLKQAPDQPEISDEVLSAAKLLTDNLTLSQAIELAEKYKDRGEARQMLMELINFLHRQLAQNSQTKKALEINLSSGDKTNFRLVKIIQFLLAAYQDLGKNLNPRLVLEHYFFQIKRV